MGALLLVSVPCLATIRLTVYAHDVEAFSFNVDHTITVDLLKDKMQLRLIGQGISRDQVLRAVVGEQRLFDDKSELTLQPLNKEMWKNKTSLDVNLTLTNPREGKIFVKTPEGKKLTLVVYNDTIKD